LKDIMTTDKILDKLSKLKASRDGEKAIGNSAAAAEAFAEAINRLLLAHELSEVDIPVAGKLAEDPIIEVSVNLESHNIKRTRVRIGWQEAMARIVAKAHLCKFLIHVGSNRITFVGTKANATVAEYAFGVLTSSADRMSWAAREEWWKEECGGQHLESGNFRAAWLHGFVTRIQERFDEARRKEVAATASSSMALVKLENALVRAQQYVSEKYTGKTAAAHMGTGNSAGYRAGRQAADNMKLGQKGVTGSSSQRLIK
jgi:hypothetical protein